MRGYRGLFCTLLLTVLLLPISAQNRSTKVEGSGCVKAGVEKGCLVLVDTTAKTTYNLFFDGSSPLPGTAIHFKGTSRSDAVSSCMQGKIVKVEEWTPLKMTCPSDK